RRVLFRSRVAESYQSPYRELESAVHLCATLVREPEETFHLLGLEVTMRAVVITEQGAKPELTELPTPRPGPGEVLVRVQASSVNGFDLSVAAGRLAGTMEHRRSEEHTSELQSRENL